MTFPAAEADEWIQGAGGASKAANPDECFDDRLVPIAEASSSAAISDNGTNPGLVLQARRAALGLTLDDVARTTKVNRQILRAIDAGDAQHLPATIYTRGFVKAYADAVGLNPDAAADEYLHAIATRHELAAAADHHQPTPPHRLDLDVRHVLAGSPVWRTALLMIAAVVGAMVVYFAAPSRDSSPTPAEVAESLDAVRAGGPLDDQYPAEGAAAASARDDGPLRLEFTSHGPCWVSIRAHGETVFARLLQAGDRATFDVEESAVVRVGEPGALSYSINGRAGRPLGRAGQPVTVEITRDNYRELLGS